jgi:hypothetical protein
MGLPALPTEPNKRIHAIRDRWTMAASLIPFVAAAGLWFFSGFAAIMTAFVGLLVVMPAIAVLSSVILSNPTPRIPADLMASPRRIAQLLATASKQGMTPLDRVVANGEIERTVDALTRLCGKEPWIAAAQEQAKVTGLDDHLKVRADRIVEAEYLFARVENPTGTDVAKLRNAMAYFVPLLASLASDFGLETKGLTASTSRVIGQVLDEPVPICEMSSSLNRLAAEWRDGANDAVDVLVRIEADAAAGRDLRGLENAWAAARADAKPEDVDSIDASYAKAGARLAATLSDAIAARGRLQLQTLEIETRFIETKHAA